MGHERTIFGLRFHSNVALHPSQEELAAFLMTRKEGGKRTHRDDLERYSALLESVQAFERMLPQERLRIDVSRRAFYGVLSHVCFANQGLKSAIEQFKYLLHTHGAIDIQKPAAFIRAAREEISRLNPRKKDQADRQARLRDLVSQREAVLERLQEQRSAVAAELVNIARYIRDNLIKIERLCETSIVMLVDLQVSRRVESRVTEDVKAVFRDRLKDIRQNSTLTKEVLAETKEDVETLCRELAFLHNEVIAAIMKPYEAVQEHARRIVIELDILLTTIKDNKDKGISEHDQLLAQMDQVLVSLVTDHHIELRTIELHTRTPYMEILLDKQQEMLDILSDLLRKERRARMDRRTGSDRRRHRSLAYAGAERRRGSERRAVQDKPDRRRVLDLVF